MGKKTQMVAIELYNDYDVDYDDWREEYAEIMEDETILTSRDNDSRFYNWVGDCLNMEWESFISNLKYYKYNGECIVKGSLGLWNGRFDVNICKFSNLQDAVNACIKGADNIIITLNNGVLEVVGLHHDGRNYFDIHLLNKLGNVTEGADLSKECYYRKIVDLY